MSDRPDDITIDDLGVPRFDQPLRQLMSVAVEMAGPVRFDLDELLEKAREQTRLEDFGEQSFRERLSVLLDALRAVDFSPFGRMSMFMMLLQMLKNRLLINDLLTRHPEIHDIEIRSPIVIAGLQRSGTTHLHNLLSADPQLRFLPYWESLEPVPDPGDQIGPDEADPRIARCEQAMAFQDAVLPDLKRMHEMTTWHAHEEIQLLANDFSTMLFEAIVPVPAYRDYYKEHDQTPHYQYLKTVLKVLTWLRGGDRWVLKSPQHLEQFGPLMRVFPDAVVVLTHRDPVPVIASVSTMNCYALRMHCDVIDVDVVGRYWADRTEDMLRRCVRDRDQLPSDRTIDVPFHEYMRSDMAVVERIYELADQPLTPEARAAMATYLERHPRGRHGRVAYRLSDFGIDGGDLRERLRFYSDRFDLEEEGAAL